MRGRSPQSFSGTCVKTEAVTSTLAFSVIRSSRAQELPPHLQLFDMFLRAKMRLCIGTYFARPTIRPLGPGSLIRDMSANPAFFIQPKYSVSL